MTATARFLLPAEAYWSPEWFALEQRALFGRTWWFVGPVTDVPNDGRPLLVEVGDQVVAVHRETNGGLRAQGLGDRRAAVEVWAGFVFVHADADLAEPLGDWLAELPAHIGAFRPDELVEVAHCRFEVASNWKLYIENHIDVYHLWYLHEQSLADYDHPRHRWRSCGDHWAFYEPPREGVADAAQFVRGFPPISHIGRDDWGSGAHLVFPNLPFATGAGFFMTYQCLPRGPRHTTIDLRVRAEPGGDHDVDAFVAMVSTVLHAEDGLACERIQAAVRSPRFAVGPLASSHELPITRFHERLLDRVRR
jgi:Rieske 2Fe-2S family protein